MRRTQRPPLHSPGGRVGKGRWAQGLALGLALGLASGAYGRTPGRSGVASADEGAPAAPSPPAPRPPRGPSVPDPAPFLDVAGASLVGVSRSGETVLFRMTSSGASQVFRTGRDGGWPHRLTFRTEGVDFAVASPDGSAVVLGYDRDGDENHALYLRPTTVGTPERTLAAAPGVRHGGVAWADDGTAIFFHSNLGSRGSAGGSGGATGDEEPKEEAAPATDEFTIRRMDVATGQAEVVLPRPGRWAVEDVGREARRLLVSKEISSRARALYVLTLATGALVELDPAPAGAEVLPGSARFVRDGSEVAFLSDRDGAWRRAYVWTEATGAVRGVAAPEGDVEALTVSPDGETLVLEVNVAGRSALVARDVATGAARPAPDVGEALVGRVVVDERGSWFFTVVDASTPGTVVRWDPPGAEGGAGRTVALTHPDFAGLPPETFAVTPKAVAYPTFDGREIPAWLYLPRGREPKGLPFVVQFHGGPASQARPGFSAERAYLLSLGFGILAPNVRGSTGYGRVYRDLDDGPLRMDAVRDGKAAADWLVASGLADPGRIAATGGSYGGFLVMALLTEHPETYAAGVNVVGIVNFETFLAQTAGYRRSHRESEYGSLADPAFLRSISPIHRVDRIRVPLLLGHGERDPRVPVGEARQIEAALKARGASVEAVYFRDEGHGFVKRPNRRQWTRRLAEFLVRHLRPT